MDHHETRFGESGTHQHTMLLLMIVIARTNWVIIGLHAHSRAAAVPCGHAAAKGVARVDGKEQEEGPIEHGRPGSRLCSWQLPTRKFPWL